MLIEAIIAGAGLASSLVSAGANIYSGYQQRDAADANAALMEQQAQYQKDAYFDQARKIQKQGQAFIGQQKAGYAGAGVKGGEGSPLAILNESRKSLQQDISRTREAGTSAYLTGMDQARLLREQGQDAVTMGWLGGGTSFLGGLGSAAGQFSSFRMEDPITYTPGVNSRRRY